MKQRTFTLLYLTFLLSILIIPWSQAQQSTKAESAARKQHFQKYIDQGKGRFDKLVKSAQNQAATPRANAPMDLKSWQKINSDSSVKRSVKSYLSTVKKTTNTAQKRPSNARIAATSAAPEIIYVRHGGPDIEDGTSWENAFNELADALYFAKENPGVQEIWVANGVYHPLYNHNYVKSGEGFSYKDQVFIMLPGIKLYGGFEGYESSVEERSLRISSTGLPADGDFTTILSGHLTLDVEDPETEMHTNKVVLAMGDLGDAALDGFVVAGAVAEGLDGLDINGEVISQTVGAGITILNSSPGLTNLIVAHNSSLGEGAGIYASQSNFVLTNSLVYGNNANTLGGGIYVINSQPVITNATIAQNDAGAQGGGIYFDGSSTIAKVRNTIISTNSSDGTANSFRDPAATVTFSSSLIRESGGSDNWDTSLGIDDGGNLDVNPSFFSGDEVFGLRPTSLAVNAGRDIYFEPGQVPDLSYITSDQRGVPRKSGTSVDIGALESQFGNLSSTLLPNDEGIMFVKRGGTGNGSSWTEAAGELADALFAANLNSDISQIWVAAGTYLPRYRPDNLSNANADSPYNTFLIPRSVAVYGGFAGNETEIGQRVPGDPAYETILSGDFAGNDNFNFTNLYEDGPNEALSENARHVVTIIGSQDLNVLLDRFTIEGAFNLTEDLEEVLLINEEVMPVYVGSGVYIQNATPGISNVKIRNNLGGVCGGLTVVAGNAIVSNSLIYNNMDLFFGSGVAAIGSNGSVGLLNTTVSQNLSISGGPAVGVIASNIAMSSSIIYDNLILDNAPDEEGNILEPNFAAVSSGGFISKSLVGGSGGSGNWKLNVPDEFVDIEINDAGGNLDEDPGFKDVFQADFSLSNCSPAIDAGEVLIGVPVVESPVTDLAGAPRTFNDVPDMGAYELQSLQTADGSGLAGNRRVSFFDFTEFSPHTFTAETGVCELPLLTFKPTNFTGQVVSRVYLDREVYSYNDAFYVQRHYDITTESDPSVAQGQVTLYFTQPEFDALNAKLAAGDLLPTGVVNGEAARKANLRIYQFHGESDDLSGEPWSYEGSRTVINPADANIVWNADLSRWEVTFDVEGFSGFFAGSVGQNPLPVRLVSFEGKRLDDEKVKLEWKVAEQVGIDVYDVEYSETGKKFSKIGQVAANSLTTTDYSFTDSLFHSGERAYYRLKINELDGKMTYSQIVSIKSTIRNGMIAYPVPAKNELWIDWKKTEATSVDLIDYYGRILKTIKRTSPSQKLDISALPPGAFILKAEGAGVLKIVKE